MSMKFCTPMKRAVSNPVCVDHAWNESQMVSSIGTKTKTAIRLVAGASIAAASALCLACRDWDPLRGDGSRSSRLILSLRVAGEDFGRVVLRGLLRVG